MNTVPRSPDLRYISRQDRKHVKGWQVRYKRGLPKAILCFFGDKAYGGEDLALVEAKAFRDQVVKIHAPNESGASARRQRKFRDKPSDLIGVYLSVNYAGARRRFASYSWAASVIIEGRAVHRTWSIKKWGYEEAFWRAARHRSSLTRQLLPEQVPAPTAALLAWADDLASVGIHVFRNAG